MGPWNEWAWLALGLSIMTVVAAFGFGWQTNPVTFVLGLLALVSGILGEGKSRARELRGRGRWLARGSIVVGLASVAWSMV